MTVVHPVRQVSERTCRKFKLLLPAQTFPQLRQCLIHSAV